MAQRPKVKPKPKKRKSDTTDTEQSARFKQMARELGADTSGKAFQRAFDAIVPKKASTRK